MRNTSSRGPREIVEEAVRHMRALPAWVHRLGYYALALLFVAAAATLRWELRDVLSPAPTLVFYLAWVGAAAFGGLGPGLLATVVSWLCIDFLFDPTPGQIGFTNPMSIARLLVLLAGGLIVSVVGERMRRTRIRQRRQVHELADLTQLTSLGQLLIRDDQDRIVLWSDGCARLYGFTADQAIGHVSHEMLRTEFPQPLETIRATLHKTGRWEGELTQYRADGSAIHVASLWVLRNGTANPVVLEVNNDITARKHAEEALRESEQALHEAEERLHLAMESGKVGVWEWEVGTEHVEWSQGVYALLGYKSGEVAATRKAFRQRIYPQDLARHEQALRESLERCEDYFCEFRVIWTDGSVHWVEARGQYVYTEDENGVTLGMRGVLSDIDRRKQAEEALRKEKALSETTIESLPGVFYLFDSQGRYLKWNKGLERVSGYTAEEISRMHPLDFFTGEDRRLIEQRIQEVFTKGQSSAEAELVSKDGRKIPYFFTGMATTIGDINCLIGTGIDITERKQAEEALRQSERQFKSTFENAAIGIAHVALDGRILQFNSRFCEIAGYPCDDIRGKTCEEITFADDWKAEQAQIQRLLGGQVDHYSIEKRYIRMDASFVWVNLTRSIQRDDAGRPEYFIVLVEDISKRKRAEEALRELNATLESRIAERTAELKRRARQLQKLTLDMSEAEDRERQRLAEILHDDLQQELAAAKFHLSLMRNGVRDDPALHDIGDQINQILKGAISKSRSLSHELSPAVLHHGDFGETLEWLANQVQAKHGLVVHVHAHDQVSLESDATKAFLYKVTQELLFNIVKHARVAEARIRVRRLGRCICLSVSDRGRGFDVQELGQTAGFGLLSIRERIELLGGRMKIRSVIGKGSTFLIAVPDGEVEPEPKDRAKSEDANRLRVLLADDHEIVRDGLASLLSEESGVEVVGQAANGCEAVDLAGRLEPDVVIMDVSMPMMSGDEATRQIKQHLPNTRVVALSMFEDSDTVERMHQAGAEAYVLKTAPSQELLAAIRGR